MRCFITDKLLKTNEVWFDMSFRKYLQQKWKQCLQEKMTEATHSHTDKYVCTWVATTNINCASRSSQPGRTNVSPMKKHPLTLRRYDDSLGLTTALPYTLLIIVLNYGGHWSKKKERKRKHSHCHTRLSWTLINVALSVLFSLCACHLNKAGSQRNSEVSLCEWHWQFQIREASVKTSCCISELPVFHVNINRLIYRYIWWQTGNPNPNRQKKIKLITYLRDFLFYFLSHKVATYLLFQQTVNGFQFHYFI